MSVCCDVFVLLCDGVAFDLYLRCGVFVLRAVLCKRLLVACWIRCCDVSSVVL